MRYSVSMWKYPFSMSVERHGNNYFGYSNEDLQSPYISRILEADRQNNERMWTLASSFLPVSLTLPMNLMAGNRGGVVQDTIVGVNEVFRGPSLVNRIFSVMQITESVKALNEMTGRELQNRLGILTGGVTYHYNNGQTNMKLTRWDLENIRLLNEYYNYYNQTRGGRR